MGFAALLTLSVCTQNVNAMSCWPSWCCCISEQAAQAVSTGAKIAEGVFAFLHETEIIEIPEDTATLVHIGLQGLHGGEDAQKKALAALYDACKEKGNIDTSEHVDAVAWLAQHRIINQDTGAITSEEKRKLILALSDVVAGVARSSAASDNGTLVRTIRDLSSIRSTEESKYPDGTGGASDTRI